MWSIKRLDISISTLLRGFFSVFSKEKQLEEAILSSWDLPNSLVCLSLRSSFDLLLQSFTFSPQSEILIGAISIPEMAEVIKLNNLVAVPYNLHSDDFSPDLDDLRLKISSRTKAIVVTYLYGAKFDLAPLLAIAGKYNVLIFEDCAQCFGLSGKDTFDLVDASMYSFGLLKTNTSLGGGIISARNPLIIKKISECQKYYDQQSEMLHRKKIVKAILMKFLSLKWVFKLLYYLMCFVGIDFDRVLLQMTKGFSKDILEIRRRPSLSLLFLMNLQQKSYSQKVIEARSKKGCFLKSHISPKVYCPSHKSIDHTYWLFPVMLKDDLSGFRKQGFDVTRRQSLVVLENKKLNIHKGSLPISKTFCSLAYVPLYNEIPDKELVRLSWLINSSSCDYTVV
jgi:perosamine synthetase